MAALDDVGGGAPAAGLDMTQEIEGVHAMSALVSYQPGAVVSRTVLRKSTGTVTPFKMILVMIRE